MATIIPKGKTLRAALEWIGQQREAKPDAKLVDIVSEASARFNLSPIEGDTLFNTILQEEKALKKAE